MKLNRLILCGHGHGLECVYHSFRKESTPFVLCTEDPNLLKVAQQEKIQVIKNYQELDLCPSDIVFTAAYKPKIPLEDLQKARFINLHYALLPRYRGMHAIVWALINGEKEVGFTLHETSVLLDQGRVIYQEAIPTEDWTSWELMIQIDQRVQEKIAKIILDYAAGRIQPIPQNEADALFVAPRNTEDCQVQWKEWHAPLFARFLKALVAPYPLPYFFYQQQKIEIVKAQVVLKDYIEINGHVVYRDERWVWVKIPGGLLQLETLRVQEKECPAPAFFQKLGLRLQ